MRPLPTLLLVPSERKQDEVLGQKSKMESFWIDKFNQTATIFTHLPRRKDDSWELKSSDGGTSANVTVNQWTSKLTVVIS